MFTSKDKRMAGEPYFRLLREEERFIEVISKNTHHCWMIFKKLSQSKYPVTIYHKHHSKEPYYHKHYETLNVQKAVEVIKKHDEYVLRRKQNV